MEKRLITKRQQEALRLCHHDHKGLTEEEAAKEMGISCRAICFLLARVEKVLPQYFPILTKQEAKIYHYYIDEGWEVEEIAKNIHLTENAVYKTLHRLKNKGMFFSKAVGRILSYDRLKEKYGEDWLDNNVKHKF